MTKNQISIMTDQWQALVNHEKSLSKALRFAYFLSTAIFISSIVAFFAVDSVDRIVWVFLIIGTFFAFVIGVYLIIMNLLKTHRSIASLYPDVFDTPLSQDKFQQSAEYFRQAGFSIYADDTLIIANKVLLQKQKLFIKRDYLLQIVVTAREIDIAEYLEKHQKTMDTYLKEFQAELAKTKNKLIKVGAFIHFVEEIPTELDQEFKFQAQQRYLLKFDLIAHTSENKLYYPSHIESYPYRKWCGQLLPAPYEEVALYVEHVFF